MKEKKFEKYLLVLIYFVISISIGFSEDYEIPNKIEVLLAPEIIYNPLKENFKFTYSATSSIKSIQEVMSFWINTSEEFQYGTTPTGWEHTSSRPRRRPSPYKRISWFAGWGDLPEGNIVPDHGNVEATPYQIKPGQSVSGFSYESNSLPGIVQFNALGFVKLRTIVDDTPLPPRKSIFEESFKGKTVGPVAVSDKSPGGLIDRLISLKDETPKYNWITNQGILNSLNAKLNAAKESMAKGNNKTAVNQLNAFINELDAQKGKHIDQNAWALLRANAEYLISKLGE